MWQQYWPVYQRLEEEFCEFTFSVSLVDDHLCVWSIRLAELLLRACQECENAAKTLLQDLSPSTPKTEELNFPGLGNRLCQNIALSNKTVELVWIYQSLSERSVMPFQAWNLSSSTNPSWYKAYNGMKHDRNANIKQANYRNVLDALAGLFILNLWLRKKDIESGSTPRILANGKLAAYSKLFDPSSFIQIRGGNTTTMIFR